MWPCLDLVARIRDVACQTAMSRVGQWLGCAGPCRAGPAPRPLTSVSLALPAHPLIFIDRAWASPAPNPSLLSTGPGPARPLTPHFYWPDPSLLLVRPRTSIGQTPHFYWPDPSLLSARPLTSTCQARPRHAEPCRTVSGRVGTVPDRAVPIRTVSPCRPDTGTSLLWLLYRPLASST